MNNNPRIYDSSMTPDLERSFLANKLASNRTSLDHSTPCPKISCSDGVSTFNRLDFTSYKGANNMSSCCALIQNGEIYLCADSMLTTTYTDGREKTLNPNFVKIAIVPSTNIAIVASGLLVFNNAPFDEFVNNLKGRTCIEIAQEFKARVEDNETVKGVKTYFSVAGSPLGADGGFGIIHGSTMRTFYPSHEKVLFGSGINYAVSAFTEINNALANGLNIESPIAFLNNLQNNIIGISKLCDKSVGGPIRILKLTPDGAEWLQNKPE